MNVKELILEKVHFHFPSPYEPSQEVLIFKNPNNAELKKLLDKSPYREARGFTNGNVVYIWNANLATHDDVLKYIDNQVDIGKFIISDDAILNSDEVKSDDYFATHKMIQRMMKKQ